MFVLTLTDDKLLKFVLIWGKSCVAFVWGEKLGWPRTLFIILLRTHNPRDIEQHKFLRREVEKKTRQSYWNYINSIFEDSNDANDHTLSKRFWSFIKHARTDKTGISFLKSEGSVLTNPSDKAVLLNKKFKSAFLTPEPMKLRHIAKAALNLQLLVQAYFANMPPIPISGRCQETFINSKSIQSYWSRQHLPSCFERTKHTDCPNSM